jgi:hypothetical protein
MLCGTSVRPKPLAKSGLPADSFSPRRLYIRVVRRFTHREERKVERTTTPDKDSGGMFYVIRLA